MLRLQQTNPLPPSHLPTTTTTTNNHTQPIDRSNQPQQVQYSSSVDIRPEWAVQEQIPFASLAKLSCAVGEPTTLYEAGDLEYYDKAYDRVTARSERPLERTKRVFRSVSTSDDPVLRRLASEKQGVVFATDAILTALMCFKSSVYSWDVVVTRTGELWLVFFVLGLVLCSLCAKRASLLTHILTTSTQKNPTT